MREARARLAELVERAGAGEPVVLRRRCPQRNAAALLPVEAVEVWQAHLAAQEAELRRRAGPHSVSAGRPGRAAWCARGVDRRSCMWSSRARSSSPWSAMAMKMILIFGLL
ncbi:hypothetical protein [Streptosporangium sp. CA-115845]|uniref:hypothetical protein n=1 Tax=Streptosporangium sp. CA-115845 TaxID=3240071 RepID=UPI003D92FF64